MLDALNITEEEAQGLAELAQHDLAMARDFARRAQAAEDADEANRYARSYQRAARSYRQTLALKARLRRDLAAADAAAAQAPAPKVGGAQVARRIDELRTALNRLAWDEAERPEDDDEPIDIADLHETFAMFRQDVEDAITEACLKPGFGAAPLDDDIARLALAQGFTPDAIAGWRDLPDPPQAALDAVFEGFDVTQPPRRESSA